MGKSEIGLPKKALLFSETPRAGEPAGADQYPRSTAVSSENTRGFVIINADDWGRDAVTTDRILECCKLGAVSAASAMVFMEDSERAAQLASANGIETGLHVNCTTSFSGSTASIRLREKQGELARYLLRHRLAQIVYRPGLSQSFEYVVAAQIEEFQRIYGTSPVRIDGHHHMHLCANVLIQRLLPRGTFVRRNSSFQWGERSFANAFYRKAVDSILSRRHLLTDYLFSLEPLEPPDRLQRIYKLARESAVELETHPDRPAEHQYLVGGELFRQIGDVRLAPLSSLIRRRHSEGHRP